ncbi:MAG: YeeE/YedE thiosulfate transporter family protein [Candidatus Thermoplasmatota archaeon]
MNWFPSVEWSPYFVGLGIGLLVWLSFLLSDKAIGCSTAYARSAGMIEKIFHGKKVHRKEYYKKFEPRIDWEWMLVIGIVVGAFISSMFSGVFHFEIIPSLWNESFGSNVFIRSIVAVFGGFLVGFGARMAGGCTSGHGISGTLQLSVSSWIAIFCFFVGGIITAFFIYNILGGL